MVRSSNWLFCIYPDSLPTDWKEILIQTHVPICISPIHDKDTNPTGEPKKPHYHVLIRFETLKSQEQVQREITDKLNATIPIVCQSVKGSIRYFTHADNPEKYQYDVNDIQILNGFDINQINTPTDTQVYNAIKDIIKFIVKNEVVYYIDLLMYSMFDESAPPLWGYTVAHNTTLFSGACKSLANKIRGN